MKKKSIILSEVRVLKLISCKSFLSIMMLFFVAGISVTFSQTKKRTPTRSTSPVEGYSVEQVLACQSGIESFNIPDASSWSHTWVVGKNPFGLWSAKATDDLYITTTPWGPRITNINQNSFYREGIFFGTFAKIEDDGYGPNYATSHMCSIVGQVTYEIDGLPPMNTSVTGVITYHF